MCKIKGAQLTQGTKQLNTQSAHNQQHTTLIMLELATTSTHQVQTRHEYEAIKE